MLSTIVAQPYINYLVSDFSDVFNDYPFQTDNEYMRINELRFILKK